MQRPCPAFVSADPPPAVRRRGAVEVPVERTAVEPRATYVERAAPIQIYERAAPVQIVERAAPVQYVERGQYGDRPLRYEDRAASPAQYGRSPDRATVSPAEPRYGSARSLAASPPRYGSPAANGDHGRLLDGGVYTTGGGGGSYFAGRLSPASGSVFSNGGGRPVSTRASYGDLPAYQSTSPPGRYTVTSTRASYGDLPAWR